MVRYGDSVDLEEEVDPSRNRKRNSSVSNSLRSCDSSKRNARNPSCPCCLLPRGTKVLRNLIRSVRSSPSFARSRRLVLILFCDSVHLLLCLCDFAHVSLSQSISVHTSDAANERDEKVRLVCIKWDLRSGGIQ